MTISQPIPPAVLAQHVAILGKTGSGKTSTARSRASAGSRTWVLRLGSAFVLPNTRLSRVQLAMQISVVIV